MRNYWNLALALSILIHLVFFSYGESFFKKNSVLNKDSRIRELEIVSQDNRKDIKAEEKKDNFNEIISLPPPYINDFIEKSMINNEKKVVLNKPQIIEKNIKEIALSDQSIDISNDRLLDNRLKKNPAYMDYYQLIREKIRKNAYRCYNGKDKGEIFLSFIILSNGQLEDLYLAKESSVSSDILRSNALRSVKEAGPFPAFPEELKDYARLQFNISIYFKNN